MKQTKKRVALLLSILLTLSFLAACGKKESGEGSGTAKTESQQSSQSTNTEEATPSTENPEFQPTVYNDLPSSLTAEKVGTLPANRTYGPTDSGISYYDSTAKKYGVMTFDGKKDTGAIYDTLEAKGDYYIVTENQPKDLTEVSGMNSYGLIDVMGNEIIPQKYAAISLLNERFARCCEVSGTTENKDEALVYASDNIFALSPGEDDLLLTGTWYIYDLAEKKPLEKASGTMPYGANAYGNYVQYTTDDKEQITVNAKGTPLPEDARLLENGCYVLDDTCYDTEDNKLFSIESEAGSIWDAEGEYFVVRKTLDETNEKIYTIVDKTGKTVSAQFTGIPILYGELVEISTYTLEGSSNELFNFAGEKVFNGTFERIYFDEFTENLWILENGDRYTFIKKDGTVLYEGTDDVDRYYYNVESSDKFYNFKDKDFTIETSTSIAPFLVSMEKEDSLYDAVEILSGGTVASGYKSFFATDGTDAAYFLYGRKEDGTIDVFRIK